MGGIAAPAVAARVNESSKNAEKNQNAEDRNPLGRPGNRVFVGRRSFDFLFAVSEIVFG
jgi:hypothetical protein